MTTMSTCTFFENVKQKNPLTSHQSLLTFSQVKANVTETLHKNAFANFIVSNAREHIKNGHDGNTMMQHEQPNTIVHEFVHVDKVCCTIICLMFFFERRKKMRAFTQLIR